KLTLAPSPVLVATPQGLQPISTENWPNSIKHFESIRARFDQEYPGVRAHIDHPYGKGHGIYTIAWQDTKWFDAQFRSPLRTVRQSALQDERPEKQAYDIEVERFLPSTLDATEGGSILNLPHILLQGLVASALEFYKISGGQDVEKVQAGLLKALEPYKL